MKIFLWLVSHICRASHFMYMRSDCRLLLVLTLLAGMLMMGCGGREQRPSDTVCALDSLKRMWDRYNDQGYYDSLIGVTRPFMQEAVAQSDTYAAVYSGLYVAQAFMFEENADSVDKYLDIVSDYSGSLHDPKIHALVNNVLGIYQLKMKLDYSEALSFFQKGYKYTRELKDSENEIILLANIVYIFYIRHDRNGMVYAQQALDVLEENRHGLDDFTQTLPYVLMAQMHYVAEEYEEAARYIGLASGFAKEKNLLSLMPTIELLQGDLHMSGNASDWSKADSCYQCALRYRHHAMPGLQTLIYLNYGDLCRISGDCRKALALYRTGLDICDNSGNMECRSELLKGMSDAYYRAGRPDSSLVYYRRFHAYADSLDNIRREQDFNRLLMSYQEMEYQNLMQAKELDLLKARRKVLVVVFVLVVICVITAALVVLFRRQKRMYKLLVSQHQKFLQRMNLMNETATVEKEEEEGTEAEVAVADAQKSSFFKELFLRMDTLVRTEKLYCQKEISLEKVAESLNTNRTYVSKAINMCAGMTFHKYVNMLRIADATSVLSDPENAKPLKQLADELGFSSVSVFYKTFQRETGCTASIYRKTVSKVQDSCDDT